MVHDKSAAWLHKSEPRCYSEKTSLRDSSLFPSPPTWSERRAAGMCSHWEGECCFDKRKREKGKICFQFALHHRQQISLSLGILINYQLIPRRDFSGLISFSRSNKIKPSHSRRCSVVSDRGHNDFFFFCCSLCPPVHALNTTVCVINSNITPPFMQPILDLFSCFTSTECLTSAEKRHLLLLAERSLTAVTAVSLPGSTQRGWIRCWVYALYAELLMNMNMCSVSIQLVYPAGCECLLQWVHV